MCDVCASVDAPMRCTGCHCAFYCCETCQKDGWSVHKLLCKSIRRALSVRHSEQCYLEHDSQFFFMGEMSAPRGMRHLVTIHVLTCFTLFFYNPLTHEAFGAHIHIGALLHSKCTFPELVPHLTPFADGCIVYVIGGHACEDNTNIAMQRYANKSISGNICRFIKTNLPRARISTELMLKFQGLKIKTIEDEAACCAKGDRFELVSLDTRTGHVIWDNGNPHVLRCPDEHQAEERRVFHYIDQNMGLMPLRLRSVPQVN